MYRDNTYSYSELVYLVLQPVGSICNNNFQTNSHFSREPNGYFGYITETEYK